MRPRQEICNRQSNTEPSRNDGNTNDPGCNLSRVCGQYSVKTDSKTRMQNETMPVLNTCPRCGAKLSGDGPEGNCPACLLALAMTPPADNSTLGSSELRPPRSASRTQSVRYFGDYELLEE